MLKQQIIKVFISSTFRDMHAERNCLVKDVFPTLREKLIKQNICLIDIDLRWGVTEEQSKQVGSWEICKQQIEECDIFLGFLGERYGSIAQEEDISITAKEIYEVIHPKKRKIKSFFYFRDGSFIETLNTTQKEIYLDLNKDNLEFDKEKFNSSARKKQKKLKEEIESLFPVYKYQAEWNTAPNNHESLIITKDLVKQIQEDILSTIRNSLNPNNITPLQEEENLHQIFITERTTCYIGRNEQKRILSNHLKNPVASPIVVSGPSGSGKSSFLASWCKEYQQDNPENNIFFHFIGASPNSSQVVNILRRLCLEMKKRFLLEEKEIGYEQKELTEILEKFINQLDINQKFIIVLDALNQLDEAYDSHKLYWLPKNWRENIFFIVSTIKNENECWQALQKRDCIELCLPPLDKEKEVIAKTFFQNYGKELESGELFNLIKNPGSQHPLFLLIAVEELRVCGSRSSLQERIKNLPQDALALFKQVLSRLGEEQGEKLVENIMSLIACSRHGLSEYEILEIINKESEEAIPAVYWAKLYNSLRPYLVKRHEKFYFFHTQLYDAVENLYLLGKKNIHYHRLLADFFKNSSNSRKMMEFPWQLLQGENWEELEQVLTDYNFIAAKCTFDIEDLLEDYNRAAVKMPAIEVLDKWRMFLREHIHLLRQSTEFWPANRILLQLALEAKSKPFVNQAAKQWLENVEYDRPWLERANEKIKLESYKKVLQGHSTEVMGAAFLSSSTCFSWSRHSICLWDIDSGKCLNKIEMHINPIDGAIVLPKGRLLCWSDAILMLWSVEVGVCLQKFVGHTNNIQGAKYLSQEHIISWNYTSTLVWNIATGEIIAHPERKYLSNQDILIMSNNRFAFYSDKNIYLWNRFCKSFLIQLRVHREQIKNILFIENDSLLSWAEKDNPRLWDLRTRKCSLIGGHTMAINGIIALDSEKFLSWSDDCTLRLWSTNCQDCVIFEKHISGVIGVYLLSNKRILSYSERDIKIWNCSGQCLKTFNSTNKNPFLGVNLLTEENILVWFKDGTILIWNEKNKKRLVHGEYIHELIISKNRKNFISFGDKKIKIWCSESGTCLDSSKQEMVDISLLSENTVLAQSNSLKDKRLHIYNLKSQKWISMKNTIEAENKKVLTDGTIITWGRGTAQIWDGNSLDLRGSFNFDSHFSFNEVDILELPDNHILFWQDKKIVIWNIKNLQKIATLTGHDESVSGACYLEKNKIVTWSGDYLARNGELYLWDLTTKSYKILQSHFSITGAKKLDEKNWLSWGAHGHLCIWDTFGNLLSKLEGHRGQIQNIYMLNDSRFLSWSVDNSIRLWTYKKRCGLGIFGTDPGNIRGMKVLSSGKILSWTDNDLFLWDSFSSTEAKIISCNNISHVLELSDKKILVCSENTLQLWDQNVTKRLDYCINHTNAVEKIIEAKQTHYHYIIFLAHRENSIFLWNIQGKNNLKQELKGHKRQIIHIEIYQNYLLSCSTDGNVLLWDICENMKEKITIEQHTTLEQHQETITDTIIFPEQKVLSWVCKKNNDTTLRLWDSDSGKCIHTFNSHNKYLYGVKKIDATQFFSYSQDHTLCISNLDGNSKILGGHLDYILGAANLNNKEAFSWSSKILCVWNTTSGNCLGRFKSPNNIKKAIALQNDKILFWLNKDIKLYVWDKNNLDIPIALNKHTEPIDNAYILSNNSILSSARNEIIFWYNDMADVIRFKNEHRHDIKGILELCDKNILTWSKDCLYIWNKYSCKNIEVLHKHQEEIKNVEKINNKIFLSWSYDTCYLWEKNSEERWIGSVVKNIGSLSKGILPLSSEQFLICGSYQPKILDIRSRSCVEVTEKQPDLPEICGVCASSLNILSWHKDKSLRVWDNVGKYTLLQHSMEIIKAGFLSETTIFLQNKNFISIWNIAQTTPKNFPIDSTFSGVCAISSNHLVLWKSFNSTFHLFDVHTGNIVGNFEEHTRGVLEVRKYSDNLILSWSRDKTLRIWNLLSEQCEAELIGHNALIKGANIFTNGDIVSWSGEELRFWKVNFSQKKQESTNVYIHKNRIKGAAILNEKSILFWDQQKQLFVWLLQSNKVYWLTEKNTVENCLALDGKFVSWRIRSFLKTESLCLWNGEQYNSYPLEYGTVKGVISLPNGNILSWSHNQMKLWNIDNRACIGLFGQHKKTIVGATRLNKEQVLLHHQDGLMRIWNLENGLNFSAFVGHGKAVKTTFVLPQGILSCSDDGQLKLWDVNSTIAKDIQRNEKPVTAVGLTNGNFLSWTKNNHILQLWDKNGDPIAMCGGHRSRIEGAEILPNGKIISWDRSFSYLWNVKTGTCQNYRRREKGDNPKIIHLQDNKAIISSNKSGDLQISENNKSRDLSISDNFPLVAWRHQYQIVSQVKLEKEWKKVIWHSETKIKNLWVLPDIAIAVALEGGEIVFLHPKTRANYNS